MFAEDIKVYRELTNLDFTICHGTPDRIGLAGSAGDLWARDGLSRV